LVENVDTFIAITDLEGSKTIILASNSKNVWLWTRYGREDLFQEFYSEDIANKNKTNNTSYRHTKIVAWQEPPTQTTKQKKHLVL
jgi:hypothetical protein